MMYARKIIEELENNIFETIQTNQYNLTFTNQKFSLLVTKSKYVNQAIHFTADEECIKANYTSMVQGNYTSVA